eukprot:gene1989-biopygen11218
MTQNDPKPPNMAQNFDRNFAGTRADTTQHTGAALGVAGSRWNAPREHLQTQEVSLWCRWAKYKLEFWRRWNTCRHNATHRCRSRCRCGVAGTRRGNTCRHKKCRCGVAGQNIN